jgi:hypothetical protein
MKERRKEGKKGRKERKEGRREHHNIIIFIYLHKIIHNKHIYVYTCTYF